MPVTGESLWFLCLLLFLDASTLAVATTPLLLLYGRFHPPWQIAVFGGAASALGSTVQLLILRWAMDSGQRWIHRLRAIAREARPPR